MELISYNHILNNVKVDTWQNAIKEAGNLLVKTNDITYTYIEEMIKSFETLGPYIVIMPGLAIAHSAPSSSVKKNSISLITLDNPINFGSENDPVKIVLCLACVDKTSHINSLSKLANILMTDNIIDSIYNCNSALEIYNLFNC